MYPFLRFSKMLVGALASSKADLTTTDVLRLSVRRGDVEAARMNNGRYLTLMDLGRFRLTLRAGYFRVLASRRWFPLVTNVLIDFQRSLRIGMTFDLSTRLVCWNEKHFYLEQWFEADGRRYAHAYVKALFRGPHGNVPTREMLEAGGHASDSPPFPEAVASWERAIGAAFGDRSK